MGCISFSCCLTTFTVFDNQHMKMQSHKFYNLFSRSNCRNRLILVEFADRNCKIRVTKSPVPWKVTESSFELHFSCVSYLPKKKANQRCIDFLPVNSALDDVRSQGQKNKRLTSKTFQCSISRKWDIKGGMKREGREY